MNDSHFNSNSSHGQYLQNYDRLKFIYAMSTALPSRVELNLKYSSKEIFTDCRGRKNKIQTSEGVGIAACLAYE